MRSLLLLLLPVMGFAQTEFRSEFNFLVSETPVEGGEYRLKGLFSDGDALGFGVDSVKAGYFFYDSKGFLYEIVYSNGLQPLTIEVDKVNHSTAPTTGTGMITNVTVNIDLPFETSKLSGKLRSLIEVDTRLKLDSSYLVDLGRLTDVDTTGKTDGSIILYDATSGNWEAQANSIDNLTDAKKDANFNLWLGFEPLVGGQTGLYNTATSAGLYYLTTGEFNTSNGYVALGNTTTGSRNTANGYSSLFRNKTGSFNTANGVFSNDLDTIGSNNTTFGYLAGGSFLYGLNQDSIGSLQFDSIVVIGSRAKTLNRVSTNEIVLGSFATGNGSNTATLGNNNITATYLKGTTNLRGYGAGNKEAADLSKTRSPYIAAFATDGTLLEVDESEFGGGSGGASDLGALTDVDTTGKTDGSIILYDETAGEWQAQANSIDNLTDGYYQSGNLALPYTGQTIIDFNQTILGNTTLQQLVSGGSNTVVGAEGMRYSTYGQQNTVVGRQAGRKLNGNDNVLIGKEAGFISNGTPTQKTLDFYNGVFIGQAAWAKDTVSTNEIVIGSEATGNGSNTATLGNNNITATYLKGTTNLRGYGAGNKEAADLSKTATDYVLRPASDGTILEQVNNIDGLSDATKDLNGNLITGYVNVDTLANYMTGLQNTLYGNAFSRLKTGSRNTGIGFTVAPWNHSGDDNFYGGYLINWLDTIGSRSVLIGSEVNRRIDFNFDTLGTYIVNDGVFIGYKVKSLNGLSVYETAIGSNVTGNGDSTATIGQTFLKGTYLNGTMNFNGYGLGNKEAADLGKTASAYIAGYATDGTLIELPSSGLGISLTDLSVTQNSPGTAGLTYNNTNGVFTYTPPDLSSYLTAEVDGSVTNEIQDLSLTGNVLSLSGDATTVDLTESVQDEINNTITAGEGISVVYDDGAGTLTISAPSGAGNTDEQTLSINNATAELSISNGNTVDLSEAIDNQVNNLFVDGTNILSTYDDISNTLTVRTTDSLTQIDAITFDNNVTDAVTGRLQYDQDKGTLKFGLANNTPIYLGTDMGWYVKNQSGSSIAKGTPVYVSGTDGSSGRKLISPMIADGSINAKLFLGITAETIANGGDGLVLDHGGIKGVNLSGFSANDVLYVSPTVAGTLVNTEPTAPNLKLPIGYVVNNASNGSLSIRSTVGTYLSENHDVQIASATNGDVLKFDGSKWVDGTDLVDDADADATNEIQTISLVGNDLTLSNSGGTVTLPSYTSESTTASNGLTLSGSDVKLGGTLTETTTINLGGTYSFNISESGSNTLFKVFNDLIEARGVLYQHDGVVRFGDYGLGSIDPSPTQTASDYLLGLTTDGTLIEVDKTAFTQDLSLTGNTLSLSGDATTVDLSGYLDNTDAQAISLTSNTLSITGNASTVDLSGYLDDQTVSLTGAGITAISGTYPNFTITSTEVDGSVTNEGQLSASTVISGTTARLTSNTGGGSNVDYVAGTGLAVSSSGGNTITYTNTLPEATTASNGLTETGTDVRLGGVLTQDVLIGLSTFDFIVGQDDVSMQMYPGDGTVFDGLLRFLDYGSGNKEAADLSKTKSNYKAAFATDGTLIEVDDIDAMVVACSDETTDITTGTAKVTFRAPHAMTITGVRASLTTASSSGNPTVDINEGGTSILGTKLTIDANEKTSTTAATAATITDTAIADDAEITIDIDAAGTGATGLKVTILYRKN